MLTAVESGKATGFAPDSATFFATFREHTSRGCSATRPTAVTRTSPAGIWSGTRAFDARAGRAPGVGVKVPKANASTYSGGARELPEREEGGGGMSTQTEEDRRGDRRARRVRRLCIAGVGEAGVGAVALEAGSGLNAEDFPMDELRNDIRNYMASPRRRRRSQRGVPTLKTPAAQAAGGRDL